MQFLPLTTILGYFCQSVWLQTLVSAQRQHLLMVATSLWAKATCLSDEIWLGTLKLAGQLRWNLGDAALTMAGRYSSGQRQHMMAYLLKLLHTWMSSSGTCKCSRQKPGTTCRGEAYPLGLYVQGCDGSCRTWCLVGFPGNVVQLLHKMHKLLHEILWSVVSTNQTTWSK